MPTVKTERGYTSLTDTFWDDLDTMERLEDESPLFEIRDGLYTLDGFLAYKIGNEAWWMDADGAVHPADLWDLRFDGGRFVEARELLGVPALPIK